MKSVPVGWRRVPFAVRLRQFLFVAVVVLLGGYLLLYASRAATPLAGDVNSDQTVNILDLSILLAHFNQNGTFAQGDLNGNGKIDIFDLSILLGNFGSSQVPNLDNCDSTSTTSWCGFGPGNWPNANYRPYSNSSPFNLALPANPAIHPQSADIVTNSLANGIGHLVTSQEPIKDYAHPIYYAKTSDPLLTITGGSSTLRNTKIYVPVQAQAAGGGDGHMSVVQPNGWAYDMWQVSTHNSTSIAASNIYRQPYNGLGIVTQTMINADNTQGGTTAPYFGLHAGIIRGPELAAGHINHALFIVIQCGTSNTSFGYGVRPPGDSGRGGSGSFVYPAFKGDAACGDSAVRAPMGARFWLDMTPAEIDATGAPAWEKTIAKAMNEYGGYMGDTGGPGFGFQFESGVMYTAMGYPNPFDAVAQSAGLSKDPVWGYTFRFGANNTGTKIPWAQKMRVILPPSP